MGCGASKVAPAAEDPDKIKAAKQANEQTNRLSNATHSLTEDEASAKISAMYRGKKSREVVQEKKNEKAWHEEAATKIAAGFKGVSARHEIEAMQKSATVMQAKFRGKQARRQSEQIRIRQSSDSRCGSVIDVVAAASRGTAFQ